MFRNTLRPSANSRPSNTARSRGRIGDKMAPGPDISNAQFLFAKLPLNEIKEDLAIFLQRELSIDELKIPTPETVKESLGYYIREVFNKGPEDMAQAEFGCVDQLDYPELYEDVSIAHATFLRYANELFRSCLFFEFGIRDIHSPERSRFQWQMSALMNFIRFRQTRLSVFEEMVANTDERIEVEKKLRDDRAKLQRDIDEIQGVRSTEEPELNQIKEQINESCLMLADHHKNQVALTSKTHERKLVLTKLNETEEEINMKLATDRDEVERLESKVVSSPHRVKAEFRNMSDTLESEKSYVSSMRCRTRDIVSRHEGLKKVLTQTEILRHNTADALEKLKLRKRLVNDIESAATRNAELQSEYRACDDSKADYEKNLASIATRIARCDEQKSNIINGNTDGDQEREDQLRQYNSMYEDKCRQRDEKLAMAEALEKEVLDLTQAFNDEIEDVLTKQQFVMERMVEFDRDLGTLQEIYRSANDKALKGFEQLISSQMF